MTNGATGFYLFIANQYRNNYEQLFDDADGCGGSQDGVITQNELANFLKNAMGEDYSDTGFRRFWSQIDTFQSGDIKRGVRDLNALNSTEAHNLEAKMEAYGKIYDALDAAIPSVYNKIKHYADQVNLTADNLYNLAAAYMVDEGALEHINDSGLLNNLAKQCACAAACDLIKEGFLKDDGVLGSVIKDSITDDYSLSGDEQLGTLIENYIQNQGANCTDINKIYEIVQTIKRIIQAYIQTAGFYSGSDFNVNSQYQYNQANGLNGLQRSVITKQLNDSLKITDSMFSKFSNYSAQFEQVRSAFIEDKLNSITDFNSFNAGNIKNEFYNSKFMKPLRCLNRVMTDYADTNQNTMSGILGAFAGCDAETLAKLVDSDAYKELLIGVFNELLDTVDELSSETVDNLQIKFEQEVLKAVKENLADLLKKAGLSDDKIENAMYWEVMGSYTLYKNPDSSVGITNGVYGEYNKESLKQSFHRYITFLQQLGDDAVTEKLKEIEYNGNTYDLHIYSESLISGLSSNDIKGLLDAVHNAIKGVVGTGGTDGTDGTNGNDGPQADPPSGNMDIHDSNVTPPDTNGRIRGEAFALSNIKKAKAKAKEQLHDYVATIKTTLKSQGFDETLLNRTVTSVQNYYDAAIDALYDQSGNGSINKKYTSHSFDYQYYDASGNLVNANNNTVGYTHHASDCVNTWNAIMNGSTESSSGLYWLESISLVNLHAIAFDKSKVWDKFCEFYDIVSGKSGAQAQETGTNNETQNTQTETGDWNLAVNDLNQDNFDKTDMATLKKSVQQEVKSALGAFYKGSTFNQLWNKAAEAVREWDGTCNMNKFISKFVEFFNEYKDSLDLTPEGCLTAAFGNAQIWKEFNNENGWATDRDKAITNFNTKVSTMVAAAINAGIDKNKANNAGETLKAYFKAVLHALDNVDWNDDDSSSVTAGSNTITYYDYSTNSNATINGQSVIRRNGTENDVNNEDDVRDDKKSGTGVYVGCDNTLTDAFYIFVDVSKMVEIFLSAIK